MNEAVLKSRYRVGGMDCAACAKKIDTAARRIDGVADVAVSVTAGTMTIDHSPKADMEKLAKRVESLGYKVAPIALAQVKATAGAAPKSEDTSCTNPEHHHDHAGDDHSDHDHVDQDHSGHDHSDHDHGDHDHSSHGKTLEQRANAADLIAANANTILQSRYRVAGMDCAACAKKIDTAARRVEGVQEVSVSVTAGTMTVDHSSKADMEKLAKRVESLGYKVAPIALGQAKAAGGAALRNDPANSTDPHHDHVGHDHSDHDHAGHDHSSHDNGKKADAHDVGVAGLHGHDHGSEEGPWWKTSKARLTILCGLALAAAFVLAKLVPETAPWAFIAAMAVGLIPIARRAIMAALNGSPFTIETLMTIAAVGAVIINASEEAAAVVFLFLVGEMLEGVAAGRARASIKALATLVPKTALLEVDGKTSEVPAESLAVGSTILVRPGDRVPADGTIISGESSIDESPMTGESVPKRKVPEDQVFAGTINQDAPIRVKVTAAAADNTIARIIQLVEKAQESKAPTERFIDRFSTYYTPAVMVVAALVAIVPPLVFGGVWNEWIYKGLAILLIGCPCALVISTPAAIAASLSAGARRGLLMKGGAVLETLGKITKVAFDKTGTLTEGKPKVTDIVAVGRTEAETLALAADLEIGSSHPLAMAILDEARKRDINPTSASEARAIGGEGIVGKVGGVELFLGSPKAAEKRCALTQELRDRIAKLNDEGKSVSVLLAGRVIAGVIAMRDEPREDAKEGIEALKRLDVTAVMLTGDNKRTAAAIAKSLGLEPRAELLPEDKQRIVGELQKSGHIVAKVGDGINDAPALAAANVGIAMGGGTDVALETADAAVLHGRVKDVANMIALSRATMSNITQNITISLGLKAVFLVTTVMGITGLWPAILADTGATVIVTANAMRLLGWRGLK
ncbi:heavy metal translocating P-type ATPase [Mesorhizobium comanense]|uniref:heavy metal translocating P-type ATPase n=1 Tax=Mesorhizobium comanense TaxID=2502215 RepID=UPI0010FA51CA|nr:heavy metal translocating P-type ATPase [Mesorhizobium comanense]